LKLDVQNSLEGYCEN